MCVKDYGIKRKVISTQNLQANAIVERAHQMLGNLMSFQLQDKPYYDPDDPWGVGKEMPISRIVVAVPNATVILLD
jgi:hypothetical protein